MNVTDFSLHFGSSKPWGSVFELATNCLVTNFGLEMLRVQISHQSVGSAEIDCSRASVHFSRDFIRAIELKYKKIKGCKQSTPGIQSYTFFLKDEAL